MVELIGIRVITESFAGLGKVDIFGRLVPAELLGPRQTVVELHAVQIIGIDRFQDDIDQELPDLGHGRVHPSKTVGRVGVVAVDILKHPAVVFHVSRYRVSGIAARADVLCGEPVLETTRCNSSRYGGLEVTFLRRGHGSRGTASGRDRR